MSIILNVSYLAEMMIEEQLKYKIFVENTITKIKIQSRNINSKICYYYRFFFEGLPELVYTSAKS